MGDRQEAAGILRPFTMYVCPNGQGLGHSSRWTGAYRNPRPTDGTCICGQQWIEEASTKDGCRYRLEFESIDPHQADGMELRYGPDIWRQLTDEQWDRLSWHPVSREADVPGAITEQYENLLAWAESHEQPIRNVRLLKSATSSWEPVR